MATGHEVINSAHNITKMLKSLQYCKVSVQSDEKVKGVDGKSKNSSGRVQT